MADEELKSDTLDDDLRLRINGKELEIFQKKSSRAGKAYQVLLREMIHAFNDGRLRIIPTEEQKSELGELYYVPGK